MLKKVRTICTLGPASSSPEVIRDLLNAGMDVVRLNFSHGCHEDHRTRYDTVRRISSEASQNVAILADLQGPKIRLSRFTDPTPVPVCPGDVIRITARDIPSQHPDYGCTYEHLAADLRPGDSVLIDDGNIRLRVLAVTELTAELVVETGGLLKQSKGINLPGVAVSSPALTDKDKEDLAFALNLGVDYIALSFVRRPEDVLEARRIIHNQGCQVPVIAKIEREEAIHCIEEILQVSDGVMVARGDMGVELSPERVPAIQKRIIQAANRLGKSVIVATQMLETMIDRPVPTRAEASDVANAILDGADATMLSGETAAGRYPIEAVQMMERIGIEAESFYISRRSASPAREHVEDLALAASDTMCSAALATAEGMGAKAIVAFTRSGRTALLLSKHKPTMPILAVTSTPATLQRTALYWGVEGTLVEDVTDTDGMIIQAAEASVRHGLADAGDFIVILAGIPAGKSGATNLVKLHRIPFSREDADSIFQVRGGDVTITTRGNRCIGCGYCIHACPFGIFHLVDDHVAIRPECVEQCQGDSFCANGCPTEVIQIDREAD